MTLLTLTSCAKYKPHSLTKPTNPVIQKNNIKTTAQRLSAADCRYYFSRNVLKKGYQPVQLYVKNQSNQTVVLDTSSINMQLENKDHVASRLHLDTTQRVVGWGIGGLFLWPLLIPAAVEGINTPQANKSLDEDFESRVLDMNSKITIKPQATLNSVFFVRKENISDKLHFDLKNTKTKIVTNFDVTI
jgi:hypothetical protein